MHQGFSCACTAWVDLLVRSWIEIKKSEHFHQKDLSTSLWGRELKCRVQVIRHCGLQSTSLWGRELKYRIPYPGQLWERSTSLWGRELKWRSGRAGEHRIRSTSLWGRELKWLPGACRGRLWSVDLLVRSWIEIFWMGFPDRRLKVDLLVRSWIEMQLCLIVPKTSGVDLLVRSWIEIQRIRSVRYSSLSTSLWGRELKWWDHWKKED